MSSLLRPLFCFLARLCILRHKPFVIGITGSFGKTTVRHILTEILKDNHKDVWTPEGNYNGEWGLALSVLQVRSGGHSISGWVGALFGALYTIMKRQYPHILVLEYGIDHAGEMKIQTDIVEPDIALFTTLSPSHLQGFTSVEEYYNEKAKLLSRKKKTTYAIGNKDDVNQSAFPCQTWYGRQSAEYIFSDVKEHCDTTEANISIGNQKGHLQTPILGQHHIGLITGAIAVATYIGIPLSDIIISLTHIHLPFGRGNILKGMNNSLVIDGTYNGGFDPIIAGVDMAHRLSQVENKHLIAVLGDMRELGNEEIPRHQELWNILRRRESVQYVFVGKVCQEVIGPMITLDESRRVRFFLDSRAAGRYVHDCILAHEKHVLVFAKGSQNTLYIEEAIKEIILPEECVKIVRQDPFYMKKKYAFWGTLS